MSLLANDNPPGLYNILHPSDFTEASDVAFLHALKIALAAKAQVNMLHVTPDRHSVRWSDFPPVRETLIAWNLLDEGSSREELGALGINVHKAVKKDSDPVQAALQFLDEHPSDLIVLAANRHEGGMSWMRKSVAAPLARESRLMTLFVPNGVKGFVSPEGGTLSLNRILVPIDRDPDPRPAVEAAEALAGALSCTDVGFTAIHVGPEDKRPSFRRMRTKFPDRWEEEGGEGSVVESILDAAEKQDADLIVMTTSGRHGFLDALRGSTTEKVLNNAPCPVLAVPAG